ncbi:MAG: hypothetical protein JRE23_13965 [Deltaproteobacteria bacterium]|nr:hypothetical protein [Deltaproteobacteria bacterium]
MSNTLNIPERTMAQIVDSTDPINTYALRPQQLGCGGPLVVRVIDHDDNDNTEAGTDTDKMAIFSSKQFGHPWVKDTGLKHIISEADAAITDATVIYPDYDYSTFE